MMKIFHVIVLVISSISLTLQIVDGLVIDMPYIEHSIIGVIFLILSIILATMNIVDKRN